MLGEVDDELKEVMGVDKVGVIPERNMFGFKNESWKEWKFSVTGLDVLVPGESTTPQITKAICLPNIVRECQKAIISLTRLSGRNQPIIKE